MAQEVFITGATGMVGSHLLVEILQQPNVKVRALKRKKSDTTHVNWLLKETGLTSTAEEHLSWIDGDINDITSLIEGMQNCAIVYHAAALVSFDHRDREKLHKANIEGTANVVNACLELNIPRLAYVSSTAAIGRQKKQPITESAEWKENLRHSPYSRSKHYSELEVWRGMEEGLTVYIVNPAIVIGEGPWHKSSARLFEKIYNGLKYFSPGANAYVDVKDVAKALVLIVKKDLPNQRFLLAAKNIEFKTVFEQIAEALSRERPSKQAPRGLAEIIWRLDWLKSVLFGGKSVISKYSVQSAYKKTTYDSSKIRKTAGLEFNPIDQTIQRTAQAFLAQKT